METSKQQNNDKFVPETPDDSKIGSMLENKINYGFKSRSEFLAQINNKRLRTLKKRFFVIVYFFYCLEAVVRSIIY